jgi:protein O-GlcNAc transferase
MLRGTIDPLKAFQQAVLLQQQGRFSQAEQLYELVLTADARNFHALCRLGAIRLQQSKFEDSERLFRRAIKIDKKSADAQHYLAFALTGLDRLEEAVGHYERSLAIQPDVPEAHNNLGHALQRLGRFEDAIARFEMAISLRPDYAEARNNLGNALHVLDRSGEAIAHYERAVLINPAYAEAHWNLANALRALGRPEEAILQYKRALAIRPDYVEALNGLGNAFRMLDRSEEAIVQYEMALAIKPAYADAHNNLGDVFRILGRTEEALGEYDKALAIRPDDVDLLAKRGGILTLLKRHDEALASFERALALDPAHADAFNGMMACAVAVCDWVRTERLSPEVAARAGQGKWVDAFTFLGYCDDPSLQLACAKTHIGHAVGDFPIRLCNATTWRHPKIRIAYVASGFHHHPTAYLMAELVEIHDRDRFEVLAFALSADDHSDVRARLVRSFDQFHDVRSKSDQEIATIIKEMQVDIAIDRSGYTTNARPGIFAYRPVPIQVNYIGFPGTLGAEFYDYIIADRIVLPFDQQPFYTEKIVHLPDCYLVNDTTREISTDPPTRAQAGLPARAFVFCSFNNNYKITPQIFEIWMRLLHRVEGSVLWLLRDSAAAERNLCREAEARGIDPGRLVFAARLNHEHHLARHCLADLFLDTLPYNAHTTASEALWAGLPLVTCRGRSFAGRVAANLLEAVGLPDLVTGNLDDYEDLALRLATESHLLAGFRERLKKNRLSFPLFDSHRYRRHIEAAYETMWDLWRRGENPRSFAVDANPNGTRRD